MTIQSIETVYNGYKFRSRLEARWAVFFDHLDIKWFYEHEGYETPHGRYLPDFWLPDVSVRSSKSGTLFEVKPKGWGSSHDALAYVADELGVGAMLATGFEMCGDGWEELYQIASWWDTCMFFYVCSKCRHVKFDFVGSGDYWECYKCGHRDEQYSTNRNKGAYESALRYRFW